MSAVIIYNSREFEATAHDPSSKLVHTPVGRGNTVVNQPWKAKIGIHATTPDYLRNRINAVEFRPMVGDHTTRNMSQLVTRVSFGYWISDMEAPERGKCARDGEATASRGKICGYRMYG
eukprot:163174-Amorphochlora_amoeboformis.AAC.1